MLGTPLYFDVFYVFSNVIVLSKKIKILQASGMKINSQDQDVLILSFKKMTVKIYSHQVIVMRAESRISADSFFETFLADKFPEISRTFLTVYYRFTLPLAEKEQQTIIVKKDTQNAFLHLEWDGVVTLSASSIPFARFCYETYISQ